MLPADGGAGGRPKSELACKVMATWVRRLASCSAVVAFAIVLLVTVPVWIPVAVLIDLILRRFRLPIGRLLFFALMWAWLEVAGLVAALAIAVVGRRRSRMANFAIQRWWADSVVSAIRVSTGMKLTVEGLDGLGRGPIVVLGRHVSLIDSIISASVLAGRAGLNPRYVLKRELQWDPCLDIVGHRLPNWFVDRASADVPTKLEGIAAMADGLGKGEVAVVFPEGTRANDRKRARILGSLAERNPERAQRLAGLRHLLPPRPAGADALLRAVPIADVVLMWHTGLEGLDGFGGIVRAISRGRIQVRLVLQRYARAVVPVDDFVRWLDDRWCEMDLQVGTTFDNGGGPWATQ